MLGGPEETTQHAALPRDIPMQQQGQERTGTDRNEREQWSESGLTGGHQHPLLLWWYDWYKQFVLQWLAWLS
jgi:hypothetical protein